MKSRHKNLNKPLNRHWRLPQYIIDRTKYIWVTIFLLAAMIFPSCTSDDSSNDSSANLGDGTITVCSFNITFLGFFTKKSHAAVASVLAPCDIAIVQELTAPPIDVTYPNGDTDNGDPQAADFFEEMNALGFAYTLSEEDTGPGETIHSAGSSTEWWVAFYRKEKVTIDTTLPHGFLSANRTHNDKYERVPYAFGFSTTNDALDFVLISVHLKPGDSPDEQVRRTQELDTIHSWINVQDGVENDFIIIGDMNFIGTQEIDVVLPNGWASLNAKCDKTNTAATPQCYDHVLYNAAATGSDIENGSWQIIDLVETMRPLWNEANGSYPGDPYDHDLFRQYYSDHHPIFFKMAIGRDDD